MEESPVAPPASSSEGAADDDAGVAEAEFEARKPTRRPANTNAIRKDITMQKIL